MKSFGKNNKELVVYQAKSGAIEFRADTGKQTLWASMQQMVDLFATDKSGISRHIQNIFKNKELARSATVAKIATVQKEGDREVTREIEYYNLDVIISVGYRINSKKATKFRQWATRVLREHITRGYTINRSTISSHYAEFLKAVDDIKALVPTNEKIDHASVLELVRTFADTWLSLDAYDKDALEVKGVTKKQSSITAEELGAALSQLKQNLFRKGEAGELFGRERSRGAIDGIVGSVMQSFGGKALYPTVEEKAAHLLYFVVKNHPFTDGNKRSGAFSFVWFLRRAKRLDITRMSPEALTALTLLIAESNPKDKEKMIGLVCRLLINKPNPPL